MSFWNRLLIPFYRYLEQSYLIDFLADLTYWLRKEDPWVLSHTIAPLAITPQISSITPRVLYPPSLHQDMLPIPQLELPIYNRLGDTPLKDMVATHHVGTTMDVLRLKPPVHPAWKDSDREEAVARFLWAHLMECKPFPLHMVAATPRIQTWLEQTDHRPALYRMLSEQFPGFAKEAKVKETHMFALSVWVSDGLLRVAHGASQTHRFFRVIEQLPLELQMVICKRAVGSAATIMRTQDSEPVFHFLAAYPWPQIQDVSEEQQSSDTHLADQLDTMTAQPHTLRARTRAMHTGDTKERS